MAARDVCPAHELASARVDTLPDHAALELGEGTSDLKELPPGGHGRVDVLLVEVQVDARRVQVIERVDQIAQRTPMRSRSVTGPAYLIRDRLSFIRFLGLGLADTVPDAKTIWTFRESLTRARIAGKPAIAVLFERFDAALSAAGPLKIVTSQPPSSSYFSTRQSSHARGRGTPWRGDHRSRSDHRCRQ
jgi:hypothetical protein